MNEPLIQTDLVSGASAAQYLYIENKTDNPQIAEVAIKNFTTDAETLPKVFSVRIESDDELHRLLYGPTTFQKLLDHGPIQLETLAGSEHQSYVFLFTANRDIQDELQNKQLHFDLALKLVSIPTSPQSSPRSSFIAKTEATPMVLGTSSAQVELPIKVEVATPSSTFFLPPTQGNYLLTTILFLSCAVCLLFFTLVLLFRRPS